MKIHTGCSGFYNKHWKEVFYPPEMPQKQWFDFYCTHFNTLELNVTFYRFPTVKVLQNWYNKSPDTFLFAVKVPKLITHEKKLINCAGEIADLYDNCETGLKEKLGCLLFQFPPSFKYSTETLELVIKSLKSGYKNVVEFRHTNWYDQEVYDTLKKNNVIWCSVSHPKLPDDIIETTSTGYVRLHGNPEVFYSMYSEAYLLELHNKLTGNKKFKEVYVFFNNTASTAGIINAQAFKALGE